MKTVVKIRAPVLWFLGYPKNHKTGALIFTTVFIFHQSFVWFLSVCMIFRSYLSDKPYGLICLPEPLSIRDRFVKKTRSRVVGELKEKHKGVSVENLCDRFGYSRQAYYKSKVVQERYIVDEAVIISAVEEIRSEKDFPRLGGQKLLSMLIGLGFDIGRDSLFDILRSNKLL